jgi:hypothetical protein
MGIAWPEIDRNYSTKLEQACGKCGWQREDLPREIACCPDCGAPLDDEIKLKFGGLHVTYHPVKNRFTAENPNQKYSNVVIFEADVPELLRFILRNWKPWDDTTKSLFGRLGLPLDESDQLGAI